jgi:hypothetical protein
VLFLIFTDECITKILALIERGISQHIAFKIINNYDDDKIDWFLKMIDNKIDKDFALEIIENYEDDKIDWFVRMIDNKIDKDFALEIIKDNTMNNDKMKNFIYLIGKKVEYKMAQTISKYNIAIEVLYDVIYVFEDIQIIKFLSLLDKGIDGNNAYDMVMLYNDEEIKLGVRLIKNGFNYNLIDTYTNEQIKMFNYLVYKTFFGFNNAKAFIETMEPSSAFC